MCLMKNKTVLFFCGFILMLMISCLGSDNEYESMVIKDAQIQSFTLSHDSITGLGSVKFTIDQIEGLIYNRDSLPYGTEIAMVICSLQYAAGGIAGVQVSPEALPDSTYWWNGTDSLDFSKPVKFVTTAYDGETTKTYIAKVNIHTVIPDSMVWERYDDSLLGKVVDEQKVIHTEYQGAETYFMYVYSSEGYQLYSSPVSDTRNWTKLPLAGLPSENMLISQITEYEEAYYMNSTEGKLYSSPDGIAWSLSSGDESWSVRCLLGVLNEDRLLPSTLTAIVNEGGKLVFARMNKDGEWTTSGNEVPDKFPVIGFGNISFSNMYHEYLEVVAGRDKNNQLTNTTWWTQDGLSWALMTDENATYFEAKEGAMLTKYDGKFCLTGGINAEGKGSKEIHFSSDYGVTWQLSDTLVVFPDEYAGRGFASIFVDEDYYMLIFGGKTSDNTKPLDELWRGRINRLGFKD